MTHCFFVLSLSLSCQSCTNCSSRVVLLWWNMAWLIREDGDQAILIQKTKGWIGSLS